MRFHLTEKYGSFMNDAIWMQFYTKEYLETNTDPKTGEKVGWNGKANCPNLSKPGLYGLGPYILTEGYIEGDRQTDKAVLKANPYYWDKENYPKVETITVFTQLYTEEAKGMALYNEGLLDITVISPEDKVETILAPYSKLLISASTDNIAIHMNLINGNPRLLDREVRRALNKALDLPNLLHFVFQHEGYLSPFSPHYPGRFRGLRDPAIGARGLRPLRIGGAATSAGHSRWIDVDGSGSGPLRAAVAGHRNAIEEVRGDPADRIHNE